MRIGKPILDGAGAGSDAGDAARFERLEREAGLVAMGAVEELRDAFAHMRVNEIRDRGEPGAARAQRRHPIIRQAGEEQHRHAQCAEQEGLADVRLQQEDDQRGREEGKRDQLAGKTAFELVGEERGGENGKGGLQEFGRLELQSAELEPAMSSVDVDAGNERETRADKRGCEDASREHARRREVEQRGADQDAHRGCGKGELFRGIGEIAGRAAAGGGRGTGRECEYETDRDQHQHGDQDDAVDRPPPAREIRIVGPRKSHEFAPALADASCAAIIALTCSRKTSPRCSKSLN